MNTDIKERIIKKGLENGLLEAALEDFQLKSWFCADDCKTMHAVLGDHVYSLRMSFEDKKFNIDVYDFNNNKLTAVQSITPCKETVNKPAGYLIKCIRNNLRQAIHCYEYRK